MRKKTTVRLIDADAVVAMTATCPKEMDTDSFIEGMGVVLDRVYDAPTVDAVPIVHGHWTEESECSQCGKYVYKGDIDNFCPHCGAKMDGERKDDGDY